MADLELIQLKSKEMEISLQKLGYSVDKEGYVLNDKGSNIVCKYTSNKVHIKTAAILPGSVIVINANPISMAKYFLEYSNEAA